MRAPDQIRQTIRGQLFATIPKDQALFFKTHLFRINTARFSTQCSVVVAMDIVSLIGYVFYYLQSGMFLPAHLFVHIMKIALNMAGILFFTRQVNLHYRPESLYHRNLEIVYPIFHTVTELCLFAFGPQDIGALLRMYAVPFVTGGISVISQGKSIALLFASFLCMYLYTLLATPYAAQVIGPVFFISVWGIIFPCAVLLSFTVYSWFVNEYKARGAAEKTHNEMMRLNDKLREITKHDPLTNLLNRRGFQQSLNGAVKQYGKPEDTVTVIMIDIDYFKLLNDKYGHLVGDECLVQITSALSQALAEKSFMLARYGGEEFIAAVFNWRHQEVVRLANELRMKIMGMRLDNPHSDVAPYVTVSIGVATRPAVQARRQDALIDEADACLYFAKRFGRNQVVHKEWESQVYRDVHGVPLDLVSEGSADDSAMRRIFQDTSVDCMFLYDGGRKELTCNQALVDRFHFPARLRNPTLAGIVENLPFANEDKRTLRRNLQQCVANMTPFFSMDVQLVTETRKRVMLSLRGNIMYSEAGEVEWAYGSLLTLEKLLAYSTYANHHALTNIITQLPNRQKLTVDLKEILEGKNAEGYLLYLDIKSFREINGVHGHVVGDKVLAEVAVRLSGLTEPGQPVYHSDVDQFVIIMPEAKRQTVEKTFRTIEESFAQRSIIIEGQAHKVGFHGVAVAYTPQSGADELLVDLDIAIQIAKFEAGRSFIFYTDKDKDAFLSRFMLNRSLMDAVLQDFKGFTLFYQPIIHTKAKRCIGAEALLRWQNDQGEFIPPTVVVPMLEDAGLMAAVEMWIFDKACHDCRMWIDQGAPRDIFVNINLSPNIISRATLPEELRRAMERYGLSARNITLEVPETAAILEVRSTIDRLASFREKGIRIAIDDFGSGYSSLSYLTTLPIDEVKVDRSFVLNLETSDTGGDFLKAVVDMAKAMDYLVCVEGVETQEQSSLMDTISADYQQGFLYGKPSPADVFYESFFVKSRA